MSLDLNRVAGLLHIVDKARQWPVLSHLHDAAMRELVEHAQNAKDDHEAEQAAKKQEQQRQAEKEAAKAAAITKVEIPDDPQPRTRLLGIPDQPTEREPTSEERPE